MLKKKKRRSLTDEERKRIMEQPGVIVHRRDPAEEKVRFEPKIRIDKPISVRELLGRDDENNDETE
jgi:hypothetical protein